MGSPSPFKKVHVEYRCKHGEFIATCRCPSPVKKIVTGSCPPSCPPDEAA